MTISDEGTMIKHIPLLLLCALTACSGASTTDLDGGGDLDATNDSAGNTDASSDTGTDAASEGGSCAKTQPGGNGCSVGECLCAGNPSTCYEAAEATACCGASVLCTTPGGGDPDAGACTFKHPLVDGGARFCEMGNCYCKWQTSESCFAANVAATCCPSDAITCF